MREIAMPGFDADDLMSWIAALGALRGLSEVTDDQARLRWRHEAGAWRLVAQVPDDPDHLAAEVWAWLCRHADAWAWGGFDNVVMELAIWASHANAADGLAVELWAALGSDACRHRKGKILASRLEYAQGGGHQDWLASLRGAVQKLTDHRAGAEEVGRVLWSPWRRQDLHLVCRWDWRCERDHALMAVDPAKGMKVQQDNAATALAALGLASLPTAPGQHGLRGALAAVDDGATVRWPIWTVPMGTGDVEALVGSQALLGPQDQVAQRTLAALGVEAVMTARRWYAGKLVVFGRGREARANLERTALTR